MSFSSYNHRVTTASLFLLWPRSATWLLYDGVIKMDLLTCLLDINSPLRACVRVCVWPTTPQALMKMRRGGHRASISAQVSLALECGGKTRRSLTCCCCCCCWECVRVCESQRGRERKRKRELNCPLFFFSFFVSSV